MAEPAQKLFFKPQEVVNEPPAPAGGPPRPSHRVPFVATPDRTAPEAVRRGDPMSAWHTLHGIQTAPQPVLTPQPSRHTAPRSALASTLAHEISATTVYSAKVLQPMKWCTGVPSAASVKRVVPSGITPWPCVARMRGHRFVFGLAQKTQSGSRHCGV